MTFIEAFNRLKAAKCPEDIFKMDDPKRVYRELAKVVHPDKANGEKHAAEAFNLLEYWNSEYERKQSAGSYGDRAPSFKPITIKTKRHVYEVTELMAEGDICNVYRSGDYVLKAVRSPSNNDLARNEAAMLKKVHEKCANLKVAVHVPELLDSFVLDKRQVNVIGRLKGYYTLTELMRFYSDGLPLADAAWIFNRILGALSAAHSADIVHGAVTPDHFMVNEDHNGVLLDWSYAVEKGNPLKAVIQGCTSTYPGEVFTKAPADFGLDLFMASKCLFYLLGGKCPCKQVEALMRACQLSASHRLKDVIALHKDFGDILRRLYGPRKFRHLAMPQTSTK